MIMLVEPFFKMMPPPGAPPGGLPLPATVVISGLVTVMTVVDLGRSSAQQAAPLLQLPANASSGHLTLTYITLTGPGRGPLNATTAAAAAAHSNTPPATNMTVQGSGHSSGGSSSDNLRSAKHSGSHGSIIDSRAMRRLRAYDPVAGGGDQQLAQGAQAPPPLPQAGCWTLILWAVHREMSRCVRAQGHTPHLLVLHCLQP